MVYVLFNVHAVLMDIISCISASFRFLIASKNPCGNVKSQLFACLY